jgi:hypothetical protein
MTAEPRFTPVRALTTALVLSVATHVLLVIVAGLLDGENSKGNGFSEIANGAYTIVFFMGGSVGNRFLGHPNLTSILIVVVMSVLLDTFVLWIIVMLLVKIIRLRRAGN